MFRNSYRLALYLMLLFPLALNAQQNPGPAPAGQGEVNVNWGGYTVHQSVDVGYRYADETGSGAMYDTLVNLHSGPRIFEQSLSMQSANHEGLLFDNLSVNSFGWGGDPNNYLRTRVEKNQWFDFRANFRRDQNFFDYNLLANPLNPSTSDPTRLVWDSPHTFETRRRMSDFDLTLLPQSRLSFRLGYSHNNMSGPSYSSVHEGTDALLEQPWNTTLNTFRAGADFKLLPRTVLSYDQTLNYYKGDNNWQLGNFYSGTLSNGQSVEFGLPFNTLAGQPCAAPITNGVANPACSGYFDYQRLQNTRNSFVTEKLSLRSNYLRRLDLAVSGSYSSGDAKVPSFLELFEGFASRTRARDQEQTGSTTTRNISTIGEAGATWHVTDHLRLVDTLRLYNFRIPGAWTMPTVTFFGTDLLSTPNVFDPATCPPPFTAATCPQHNASSSADVAVDFLNTFLKQDQKQNTLELQYDVNRRWSTRIGYRFLHRSIVRDSNDLQLLTFYPSLPNRGACTGQPLDANGVCTTTTTDSTNDAEKIQGQAALAGFSARPIDALRMSFDTELFFSNAAFTRISPRKEFRNRFQTTYTPRSWAVVGASINLLEDTNADSETHYRSHFRNYGFNASLAPKERVGFDLAYNFNDALQNAYICFNDTPPVGVSLPVVNNAAPCAADPFNPLQTDSYYINNTHFGSGSLMLRPAKRVTAQLGYSLTRVDGKTPQFNFLQPLGTLAYNYQQPIANVSVELARGFSWNGGYNYHQYNESFESGPTAQRYFHANQATFGLHYAF